MEELEPLRGSGIATAAVSTRPGEDGDGIAGEPGEFWRLRWICSYAFTWADMEWFVLLVH
jgi:hypothetical protein